MCRAGWLEAMDKERGGGRKRQSQHERQGRSVEPQTRRGVNDEKGV